MGLCVSTPHPLRATAPSTPLAVGGSSTPSGSIRGILVGGGSRRGGALDPVVESFLVPSGGVVLSKQHYEVTVMETFTAANELSSAVPTQQHPPEDTSSSPLNKPLAETIVEDTSTAEGSLPDGTMFVLHQPEDGRGDTMVSQQ